MLPQSFLKSTETAVMLGFTKRLSISEACRSMKVNFDTGLYPPVTLLQIQDD